MGEAGTSLRRGRFALTRTPKNRCSVQGSRRLRWARGAAAEHHPPETSAAASFSGSGVSGGGLVSGLSTRGCTIVTDELIERGTTVALQIQLPEPYTPLKVDLAEVRWADGRDAGLEFLRLRLEEKRRLQGFIRSVQSAKGGGP